jgi:hypothetical protein
MFCILLILSKMDDAAEIRRKRSDDDSLIRSLFNTLNYKGRKKGTSIGTFELLG